MAIPNDRDDSNTTRRSIRVSEEAAIYELFARIIRNKFSDTDKLQQLDKLYKSSDYLGEKAKLTRINNNGMPWALGVGIGTFIFLRRGPPLLTRYMLSRRSNPAGRPGSGGYAFDASGARNPFSSPDAGAEPPRPGIIFRSIKLGFDLFVSTGFAVYSSVFFTDRKKMLKDISQVPLVEGRSLISDEFCTDFKKLYKEIPKEAWSGHRGKGDSLDAIENFVLNCKRRELYEKQLKAERGLLPGRTGEHTSIPPPGVPKDLYVSFDDISEEEKTGSDSDTDFANTSESERWEEDGDIREWNSIEDFERGRPDGGKR